MGLFSWFKDRWQKRPSMRTSPGINLISHAPVDRSPAINLISRPPGDRRPSPNELIGTLWLLDKQTQGYKGELWDAQGYALMPPWPWVVRVFRSADVEESASVVASMFDYLARVEQCLHPHIHQIVLEERRAPEKLVAACSRKLAGGSLWSLLQRARALQQPLPLSMICTIASQICEGMRYGEQFVAYDEGDGSEIPEPITHGDLTPRQVMFQCKLATGEINTRLVDFGLGFLKHWQFFQRNRYPFASPSPAYWSPEHHTFPVSCQSDIFSWGVMLWEMLTNRYLFLADQPFVSYENALHKEILPPSVWREDCPPALEALVLHALERDPAQRLASWSSAHDALEDIIQAESACQLQPAVLRSEMHDFFQAHVDDTVIAEQTPIHESSTRWQEDADEALKQHWKLEWEQALFE